MRHKKKKIELFINSLQSGGAEHQICFLANFLADSGYSVRIATINDGDSHYYISPEVRRISISKSTDCSWVKMLRSFFHFVSLRVDCLISFCQKNNYIALKSLSYSLTSPRVIICGERNHMPSPGKYESILFRKLYRKYASYVVSNSYSRSRYLNEHAPFLSNKIYTIINYTELSSYKPTTFIRSSVIKVLVMARVQRQKNCHRFVEAISELRKKSNESFIIDWYGSCQFSNASLQAYVAEAINLVGKNHLNGIFSFHEPVSNVPELISQYDVVCLPSLFEGFSNSVAEGIASGKPMLVSDVSDNSIMVKNGENGFLFDPNCSNSIVDAFLKFFSLSDEKIRQMGEKSRQIAEELFSKEAFVDTYIRLIES